jgi:branched-chain amino acid transport system ATP-binding protein
MLKVHELDAYYGQFHVLKRVSLSVARGEVVVLLGPNGHGKSTLLKAVCGLMDKVCGRIEYQGEQITGQNARNLVNRGITYIAETRELFPLMTVLENLKLGAYSQSARPHEKENLEAVLALFPRLAERRRQIAATLSGGEARMLAIARGLMSNADFLCIDEPSLGLQPNLRQEVFRIIDAIHRQGKSILLVEQNMPQVSALAQRIYLLEEGCIRFAGDARAAAENPHLREIFLGM